MFNHQSGIVEDVWSQLKTFVDNISMVESDDTVHDTENLCLSQEPHDLLGFPELGFPELVFPDPGFPGSIPYPDECDILMAFGDSIIENNVVLAPLVEEESSDKDIVQPCSTCDYVYGAKTYASKSFNMLLGIAMVVAYHQDVKTRVPGSILGEFCGDVALENMILYVMDNANGFVTRRVVGQTIEVSIKRSILHKLFQHEGNESGSSCLSDIFLGRVGKFRSSANIRKIWGSLYRDIKIKRAGKGGKKLSFLDKVGYRKLSAKNCEFILRLPVVLSEPSSSVDVRV